MNKGTRGEDRTYPDTDSYRHGNVRRTGIGRFGLGRDVREVVSFQVFGIGETLYSGGGEIIKRLKNIENAKMPPPCAIAQTERV